MRKKHKRPWGVFLAIILPTVFGSIVGKDAGLFGVTFYTIFDTIGTMFLNALTLVVVPLVSSSIISGIARIGGERGFGRLGGKMFLFYFSTSLIAIFVGLFFVNLIAPGHHSSVEPLMNPDEAAKIGQLKARIASQEGQTLLNVLL